ncbi:MAG: DUF1800 family protein [Planctomycetota bacterium]
MRPLHFGFGGWLQRFSLFVAAALLFPVVLWAGDFQVEDWREGREVKNRIRAAQFLHRATFGPTMEQIEELADRMRQIGDRRAMREWIDNQFELPPTFHQPLAEQMIEDDGFETDQNSVNIQRYRWHAFYDAVLNGEDQLRQRVAWALAQIVVTSEDGAGFNDRSRGNLSGKGRWLGPTNYYDMLVRHSFGNYRDILNDATYHPVMGVYLSHMRNRKSNGERFPDENYAREIMQLFSIGLYELRADGAFKTDAQGEPIPTYDNETIKAFARIFTGLTFKPTTPNNVFYSGNDFQYPMVMFQPEHDTDPKTVLGGEVIDLKEGNAEIQAAIDNIFSHKNVAPFISYRLIQRLVKSNPSRGYIRRVARRFENNGRGVKGDMKAVVKAILTDREAFTSIRLRARRNPDGTRTMSVAGRGTSYSRLREPVIRYTSLLRACRAESDYPTGRAMVLPQDYNWNQAAYRQPTVFSFFMPTYQPPGPLADGPASRRLAYGRLVAPEFQQKTAVTSNRLMNRYIWDISSRKARFSSGGSTNPNYQLRCEMIFDLDREDDMSRTVETLPDLVDHFDILHCCGTMPQDYKDKMVETINTETSWMPGNTRWSPEYARFRTHAALMATVLSPFAAIGE